MKYLRMNEPGNPYQSKKWKVWRNNGTTDNTQTKASVRENQTTKKE